MVKPRLVLLLPLGTAQNSSIPSLMEPVSLLHQHFSQKSILIPVLVLPVLHLNGYKINNPTILARISHKELEALFIGYGWTPYFVEGSDLESMHQAMAATVEKCVLEIKAIQKQARDSGKAFRPMWPMIILRSPKGWTGPRKVDGKLLEGYWRSHQVSFHIRNLQFRFSTLMTLLRFQSQMSQAAQHI